MRAGFRTSIALTALMLAATLFTGGLETSRAIPGVFQPAAAHARDLRPASANHPPIPVFKVKVIDAYPHDYESFTQGLIFRDGFLYESTGLNGKSGVRQVELKTGKVINKRDIPAQYFGEGLTEWGETLIQLTWKSGKAFVYNREDLRIEREFSYSGEGWGITQDGRNLIMSDGSPRLTFLAPDSFTREKVLEVSAAGKPVPNLNELEYVKGEILANIWQSDTVARISPETGEVTGWIDMSDLRNRMPMGTRAEVLNGIAYDAKGDRLFITGKLWPRVFHVEIVRESR
ncbi:MAG: glutaminyl-peptide cyclotransferase [Syntrophobacter sp.]